MSSYPGARTIHVVMDNLNIHGRKSLTDYFGEDTGRLDLEPPHRPLHAQAWELAEPGGNRDQPVFPAMPGASAEFPP